MSHAVGAVKFADGEILFYEYNGTSDVAIPQLWPTTQEVDDNWRSGEWRNCQCAPVAVHEPVSIMTTYGGGFYWNGRACRQCMSIVDGFQPFLYMETNGYKDGEPAWSPWRVKAATPSGSETKS